MTKTTAGIILAAGGSKRLGKPKPLIIWQGKPLVWHAANTAIQAGLSPVIVVVGAVVEPVIQALSLLDVIIIINPNWVHGQSTSIRIAMQKIPDSCDSVIFLLSDQPFVSVDLINLILIKFRDTAKPIIIPRVEGQNANPVLFSRPTFYDLENLTGDIGGRALFTHYPVEHVNWEDQRLLLDIDTPQDYQILMGKSWLNDWPEITAVILAAGQSKRMGAPKLTLPWGATTVINRVVNNIYQAGLHEIIVVTGAYRELVENALQGAGITFVYNPNFNNDKMLISLQTAIRKIPEHTQALLLALGDQPQIQSDVIRKICLEYHSGRHTIVVPSWEMNRGHPWIIDRTHWPEIQMMAENQTMRDFLNRHSSDIHYLNVDSPLINSDLDTPEQYDQFKPIPGG